MFAETADGGGGGYDGNGQNGEAGATVIYEFSGD